MLEAITKLFHNTLIKTLIWIAAISVAANLLVLLVSRGHCYASAEEVPNACFGLILGTGRSAAPSPYYDGRVQAAIDLWKAKKVVAIIISGENQYEDYQPITDKENVRQNIHQNVRQNLLSVRQNQILKLIRKDKTISAKSIAEALDINAKTIYRELKILNVHWIGSPKNGYWERV